jgi:hypothetical protein
VRRLEKRAERGRRPDAARADEERAAKDGDGADET